MTEVTGFPRVGVSAHTPRLSRAGCRQAVRRDRTVLCGRRLLPSGGFVSRRGTGVWKPTLQHGGACSHRPQNAERSDVLENRSAIFERFNSRWTPRASPPQSVAGAAWRHSSPSSGPAYGGPCTQSVFGPDAVSLTNKLTNKSMSVLNEWYGQALARHAERRGLRAAEGRKRRPRRDVGRMVTCPVGNPAGRGNELSGTERTRFLPRLKPWVSALWYL